MSSRSAILDQIRRQLGRGPLTPEAVAALAPDLIVVTPSHRSALGLIEPFAYGHKNEKNLAYLEISNKISQIQFENNTHVEKLVESAVFESLEAIRQQVKIKQWQQILEQHDQVKE